MVSRRVTLAALAMTIAMLGAARAQDPLTGVVGRSVFEQNWISAPSSTPSVDGLGPHFDARACAACHPAGGPGAVAFDVQGQPLRFGMIARLGRRGGDGDPVYGTQLNTRALQGLAPEGRLTIGVAEDRGRRRLSPSVTDRAYGPLARDTGLSLRRAPSLRGAGRLATVPDAVLLARAAQPQQDGVRGRPNRLADSDGKQRLGRFGWKAAEPDLAGQVARAFSRDMGLSTRALSATWGDCTERERDCRAAPSGAEPGTPEIADGLVAAVVAYLAALPRPHAPPAMPGRDIFVRIGCAACHASLEDGAGNPVEAFTDLLLHDMGPGLADGLSESSATGSEWRTAPLWSLSASVKAGGLLHDGRARDVGEAIAWHDGEAAAARDRALALSPVDRAALFAFLNRL